MLHTFHRHSDYVMALAVAGSPAQPLLASAGLRAELLLWDVASTMLVSQPVRSLPCRAAATPAHDHALSTVACSCRGGFYTADVYQRHAYGSQLPLPGDQAWDRSRDLMQLSAKHGLSSVPCCARMHVCFTHQCIWPSAWRELAEKIVCCMGHSAFHVLTISSPACESLQLLQRLPACRSLQSSRCLLRG